MVDFVQGQCNDVEYELRDHAVKAGELKDWLMEWKAKILPLRERFGFQILGAWAVMGENRFVWILGYHGPSKTFAEADRLYYNSQERKSISPNPARHLAETTSWMMKAVA